VAPDPRPDRLSKTSAAGVFDAIGSTDTGSCHHRRSFPLHSRSGGRCLFARANPSAAGRRQRARPPHAVEDRHQGMVACRPVRPLTAFSDAPFSHTARPYSPIRHVRRGRRRLPRKAGLAGRCSEYPAMRRRPPDRQSVVRDIFPWWRVQSSRLLDRSRRLLVQPCALASLPGSAYAAELHDSAVLRITSGVERSAGYPEPSAASVGFEWRRDRSRGRLVHPRIGRICCAYSCPL